MTLPLAVESALSLLHSLTTTQAAPTMMRIGRAEDRAEVLAPLVERFARWSWPRAILQALNAAALVWALIALRPGEWIASSVLLAVVVAATSFESVLAGAALDQVVVQLPARRRVGVAASAAYLRATDLAAGRVVYPLLGLCSNARTVAAFALALWLDASPLEVALLGVAAAGGVAAFLVTRRAVPVASQLAANGADNSAGQLVERFDDGARVRAPLFLLVFACLLATLVAR